jgi:hypothetical protein
MYAEEPYQRLDGDRPVSCDAHATLSGSGARAAEQTLLPTGAIFRHS